MILKRMPFYITVIYSLLMSHAVLCQGTADSMLNFIQQNRTRSSFYLQQNDSIVARLNEDKVMPLASTVKLIIAIEFAKQAAAGIIKENQYVPLKEPGRYYIPDTDGGAHPAWLKYEHDVHGVRNDSIKLIEVAKGMIMFSSNANAEYLLDLLGPENVRSNIKLLGLRYHTTIYPLVSSLFMYQNPRNIKPDKILKEIRNLPEEQYAKYIYLIHNQLKHDSTYSRKFRIQDMTLTMQKLWSDRLPASTAKEYVKIAAILNRRKYFDTNTYRIISAVLETIMENPANQSWLLHAGMKGGSTSFVLTKTLYATLKNGQRVEMSYFFNDLKEGEGARLQTWMNEFDRKVLSDEAFRKKIRF